MPNISSPEKIRAKKLGESVVRSLNSRFFDAYYCDNSSEAKALALSLIPDGASIGFGGSASISQIGLLDALRAGDYNLIDRDSVPPSERGALMRKALTADVFLTSTNALTEDGQLFNIDGNGNRVAAMIYGPESVIVIAGINKVVKDVDTAISRARNLAAPTNAQRFDIDTPCNKTGACADCKSTDCICAYMVTTRICRPAKKIKVIIVGENLGF